MSIPDPQLSQTTVLTEKLSKPLLAHEEIVSTTDQKAQDTESEVMREVRNLVSVIRSERWLDTETRMVYHTNEFKWGGDGVPEGDMVGIKQTDTNKTPTNADCIKYLYNHEKVDDQKAPDAIYYRRCKKPTTAEEVYLGGAFG